MSDMATSLCNPAHYGQRIRGGAGSTKAKYVGRTDFPRGVRAEMSKVYAEARRGTITTSDAYRLALVLSMIAKVIETTEIAEQLEELAAAHPHPLRRIA